MDQLGQVIKCRAAWRPSRHCEHVLEAIVRQMQPELAMDDVGGYRWMVSAEESDLMSGHAIVVHVSLRQSRPKRARSSLASHILGFVPQVPRLRLCVYSPFG
jgi:hypothetical protein